MMKTVFLFVDKPTFIGDILKTQYLPYLASKYRVIVFTNHASQDNIQKFGYPDLPNIFYIHWQPKNQKLLDTMKFLRFSCTREFDHLATTRHFRNRRGQDGNKTWLRIISTPFFWLLTSNFLYRLELVFLKGVPEFLDYVKKYQPVLVLTSTPGLNNFEAEAILLANKVGLPTVAANCGWDNLTTRATRVRPAKYFIAWHEPMKKEAIEIHKFKAQNVFISGPIRYDYYVTGKQKGVSREDFLQSKGLNEKYKTILYTTQKAHLFEEAFIKKLIELRNENKIPYVNILIRIHPLASPNRFQEFASIKDVCLYRPNKTLADEDLMSLKYSLMNSDLNINYSSTISLESMFFDKPVINYYEPSLKSFELNHYAPLIESKSVRLIDNDKAELASVVKDYLEHPEHDSEKRRKMSDVYFPFQDGLSYKRNIDFLDQIIKNEETI